MNFKIRCNTEGESWLAQQIAIKKGAVWQSGDKWPLYREPLNLYCRDGRLSRDDVEDNDWFNSMSLPEINLSELNRL